MFRCLECDAEFEEPVRFEESRGEYWGVPCSETLWGCPYCHGEYEEIKEDEDEEDEESEGENDD